MSRPFWLAFLVALPLAAQVKITQADPGRITVDIDGKPFTTFFVGEDTNKPYLHPLRSASGKVVTRYYPMELVEGESRDHPHHRGLWFTHGDVNGYDFWANEASQKSPKKGRVVLKNVRDLVSGKQSGAIAASFDWVDSGGKPLLTEDRRMVFHADPALRTVDFDITLAAAGKVTFGDTKEGTFAVRLAASLEEPEKEGQSPRRTGTMINAQGKRTEKEVWGKRSEWVDYFGEVDGEKLGIAILDHPGNPRHPTWWHSRGYGLFAANMFGLHDFERDKAKDGSLALAPGEKLRLRYRVIIHPGDYQSAGIAAQFERYARVR
jgi:hypothetical protein